MEEYIKDSNERNENVSDDRSVKKEEEDISVVAEKITSKRRYIPEADSKTSGKVSDAVRDGAKKDTDRRSPGHLFSGFTLQKAAGNILICLAVLAILFATASAAVKMSNDKVVRDSDFDIVSGNEDLETARLNSENNRKDISHSSYDTKDEDDRVDEPAADEEQFRILIDFYDRDDIELYSTKITLGELLERSGITLEDGEVLSVPEDSLLAADTSVAIDKIEYVADVVTEALPYETEQRETDLIPRGTTNYYQYGKEGKAEKTYTVTLKNGQEIDRRLDSTDTIEYPQNEIYEIGVGGSFVGGDGVTYTYSYRKIVKATYYYLPNDPYTYLGNHPDDHTIAVDPSSIPLRTWVYVKNSKYDFGLRQAQDIGGAVKGDMIDIWLDGSEPGYSSFAQTGIHYDMEVYFVD